MEKSEAEIGFSFFDEIEEEIMIRLPTKSLSRFNCVSKTWYDRINCSSQFARNHLKRQRQSSQSNNLNLMLHGSRGPLHSISCSSSSNHCDNDAKKIQHHHQPLLVELNDHRFNIVGSCDGLLLVVATTGGVGGNQVIYIWNPTTGEYKTLPQLESYMKSNIVFGFGPDLTTNNNNHYKVLLLETESKKVEFKVNMYSTQTNSWKTLLPNAPFCYSTPHPQGMILLYDNLHFLAEIDAIEEDPILHMSIISFDLKDDKFRVLPMPPGTLLHKICVLDGHLCAFSNTDDEYDIYCIWRMENFGVKKEERWNKICSIDSCLAMDKPIDFISPLHILEDGQILLYAELKCENPGKPFIVLYNIENKKASFFVQGNVLYIPVVYEESFISPNAPSTAEEELPQPLKRRRTYIEKQKAVLRFRRKRSNKLI